MPGTDSTSNAKVPTWTSVEQTTAVLDEEEWAAGLILNDIFTLKTMSMEIVVQLLLDGISQNPLAASLTRDARRHLNQELTHVADCQRELLVLGCAIGKKGAHVRYFATLMRLVAFLPGRTAALAAATALCTAIECSALPTVAKVARQGRLRQVLRRIASDELEHYDAVAALRRERRLGLVSHAWALGVSTALGVIAVLSWWPRVSAAYRVLGLQPQMFASDLLRRTAEAFPLLRSAFVQGILGRIIVWATSRGAPPERVHEGPERLPV